MSSTSTKLEELRELSSTTDVQLADVIIELKQQPNVSSKEIESFKDWFSKMRRERGKKQRQYFSIAFDDKDRKTREELLAQMNTDPAVTPRFLEIFLEWYDRNEAEQAAAKVEASEESSSKQGTNELPKQMGKFVKQAKMGMPVERIVTVMQLTQAHTAEEIEMFKKWYNSVYNKNQEEENNWQKYKDMTEKGLAFPAVLQLMTVHNVPKRDIEEFQKWYQEKQSGDLTPKGPPSSKAECSWNKYKEMVGKGLPFPAVLQIMNSKKVPQNDIEEFKNWYASERPNDPHVVSASRNNPPRTPDTRHETDTSLKRFEKAAKAGLSLGQIHSMMSQKGHSQQDKDDFTEWYNEQHGNVSKESTEVTGENMEANKENVEFPSEAKMMEVVLENIKLQDGKNVPTTAKELMDEYMIDLKLEFVKFSHHQRPLEEMCTDPLASVAQEFDEFKPEIVSEGLVQSLFRVLEANRSVVAEEVETVNDLLSFTKHVLPLLGKRAQNALTLSCKYSLALKSLKGDIVNQSTLFLDVVNYYVVKEKQEVFLPCSILDKNFFGLFIRPVNQHFVDVAVCTKDAVHYHPHTVCKDTGAIQVCPFLLLEKVELARLVSKSFAVTLMQVCHDDTVHLAHRNVYEVLLPFLARNQSLPHFAPELYAEPEQVCGMWMTKASGPLHMGSHVQTMLLILRHHCATVNEWKRLKLDVLCTFAKKYPQKSMSYKLANTFAKLETKLDEGTRKEVRSILNCTLKVAEPANAEPTWPQAGRFNPEIQSLVDSTIQNPEVLSNVRLVEKGNSPSAAASESPKKSGVAAARAVLLHSTETLEPTGENIHLLRVLTDDLLSMGRGRACIAVVQFALTHRFPMDPSVWEQTKDNCESAQQLSKLQDILEVCFNVVDSCFLVQQELTGHHAVLFAQLYAISHAIMLNKDSKARMSQLFQNKNIHLSTENVNGVDYNATTSLIPLDAHLSNLRANTIQYFESLKTRMAQGSNDQDLHIWSFSKAQPDQTYQVVGELTGIQDSPAQVKQYGKDFGSYGARHFNYLRDIAFLFQYMCVPLPDDGKQGETRTVQWGDGSPYWYAGEEYILPTKVVHLGADHPFLGFKRQYRTKSNAAVYFPKRTPFHEHSTEHTLAVFHSLPNFSRQLTDEDAERVLSFLTTPLLRIPSLLGFFVEPGNESFLFHEPIRELLFASILEPFKIDQVAESGSKDGSIPGNPWSHLPSMGLLHSEIQDKDSPTAALFLELLKCVIDQCKSTAMPSSQMLSTLVELAYVGANLEAFEISLRAPNGSPIGNFLRECYAPYLLEHGRFDGFCMCFLNAPSDTIAQEHTQLALVSTQAVHMDHATECNRLAIQQFLVNHAHVLCKNPINSSESMQSIFEASGMTITNPIHYERDELTGVWQNNFFRFDPLLGEGYVISGTLLEELPEWMDEVNSSLVPKDAEMKIYELKGPALENEVVKGFLIELSDQVLHLCIHGQLPTRILKSRTNRKFDTSKSHLTCISTSTSMDHSIYLDEPSVSPYVPKILVEQYNFWLKQDGSMIVGKPKSSDKEKLEISRIRREWVVRKGAQALVHSPPQDLSALFDNFENANYVLFWKPYEESSLNGGLIVDLPRYKLTFVENQDGEMVPSQNPRLCLKRDAVQVSPTTASLRLQLQCLRGIEQYLVLLDDQDQYCVMFPHLLPPPPAPASCEARVYLLTVSPLQTSFLNLGLESAVALFAAKLRGKEYYDAFNLAHSCATSRPLPPNLSGVAEDLCFEDRSIAAVACRLKFHQAVFVQNGEPLPKGSRFAEDLEAYLAHAGCLPRNMLLSSFMLRELTGYARQLGTKPLSRYRMCPALDPEGSRSTRPSLVRAGAVEALTQRPRAPPPQPVAHQGGGGFKTLQLAGIEKLDEIQIGGLNSYTPNVQHADLPSVATAREILRFAARAMQAQSPDYALVGLVSLLRGPVDGSAVERVAFVQLLALRLYLQKQAIQGTVVWESTTFYMLAVLAAGVCFADQGLPPAPVSTSEHRAFLRKLLRVCKRLRDTPGFRHHCRPRHVPRIAPRSQSRACRPSALESSLEGAVVYPEGSVQASTEATLLFERCAFFQSLLLPVKKTKVLSVPSLDEVEGEKQLIPLLRKNEVTQACLEYIDRIEQDVSFFDGSEIVVRHEFTSDDLKSFEFALDQLNAAKEKWHAETLEMCKEVERSANRVQDKVLQVCNRQLVFTIDDLIRLGLIGKSDFVVGCDIQNKISDLMVKCTELQQLGLIKAALESLISALRSKQEEGVLQVEKDLLKERLEIKRMHKNYFPFLCFEFEAGYLLRKPQIDLVESCISRNRIEECGCQQMKMGDGKSSTIIPLLSVFLHELEVSQKTMVVVVVPPALLEMEEGMIMRSTSRLFQRRIIHFEFKRDTVPEDADLGLPRVRKIIKLLQVARDTGGVVLTTASSLKAYMLRFVEMAMFHDRLLQEGNMSNVVHDIEATGEVVGIMQQTMDLFADSRLLLDECDVSFHPLRSELNYPVGIKKPLVNYEWRVNAGALLLNSLFSERLKHVVQQGIAEKVMQDQPHVLLVEPSYYFDSIAPELNMDLAEWILEEVTKPNASLIEVENISATASTDSITAQVDSLRKSFELGNAFTDEANMWCSEEYPKESTITFAFPESRRIHVGALDITFRQYSSFFGVSGWSMLPSSILVEWSFDDGKTFLQKAKSGEFLHRRLYFDASFGDPTPSHIRLVLRGPARWFGVERIRIFQRDMVDPDQVAPHTRPQQVRILAESLLEKDPEHRRAQARVHCGISTPNLDLVDIAHEYLMTFLPHALGKINTVHHGLIQRDLGREFGSRRFMSVPFVGKDTPSPASEFSHPDVLVLLTLLAYKDSGLREADMHELMRHLQQQQAVQPGPTTKRKAYVIFSQMLESAARGAQQQEEAFLPLHLFNVQDDRAMTALWKALCRVPEVIEYYCTHIAFPRCLAQRAHKLTATGEDLVLVCARSVFGFSGTPNAALPLRIRHLEWEAGTEGQFLRLLGRSQFVSVDPPYVQSDHRPLDILREVSNSSSCALIDCGALITGLSNKQVAEALLRLGLDGKLGVVYLDELDRKMVLQRTRIPNEFETVALDLSPIPVHRRFTFYDQVHTVGMDIVQPPSGNAVVTVNKDMIFRDFAQACYRMRRLGKGQTLRVVFPDTVARRMARVVPPQVALAEQRVVFFLLRNTVEAMKGELELLAQQNLSHLWRRKVLHETAPSGRVATALAPDRFREVFVTETQREDAQGAAALLETHRKYLDPEARRVAAQVLERTGTRARAAPVPEKAPVKKRRGLMKYLYRRLSRRKAALDSQSQEVASRASRSGNQRSLAAEQQQQKEKERQVDMGEYKEKQPRSWVSDRDVGSQWGFRDNSVHGLEENFVELTEVAYRQMQQVKAGGKEPSGHPTKTLKLAIPAARNIYFSIRHTNPMPTVNSRILNVEYALRDRQTGLVMVVTLAEASTLRYQFRDDDNFKRRYQLIGLGHARMFDLFSPFAVVDNPFGEQLALLKFFNINKDLEQKEVEQLVKIFHEIPSDDLHLYYLDVKRGRRRTVIPGFETSEESNLRVLFV